VGDLLAHWWRKQYDAREQQTSNDVKHIHTYTVRALFSGVMPPRVFSERMLSYASK